MKYYLDTEFIEGFHKPLFGKKRHFIDLISIGIVAEDGRELYLISNEYNYNDADDWVKENVIIPLYLETVHGDMRNNCSAKDFHKIYGISNNMIATEIKAFIYSTFHNPNEIINWEEVKYRFPVDFYAYYADYDWVVFSSLFGRMIDLPKGFPMYCIDLKQSLDEYVRKEWLPDSIKFMEGTGVNVTFDLALEKLIGLDTYPKQENEHSALDDAKWNMALHKFLLNLK